MIKHQPCFSLWIKTYGNTLDKVCIVIWHKIKPMSKCLVETIDCTMLKLRKNIAVPQMSIWKQNKALGTYCVSAYICRTKQWSFFFWYYYIQHGIEKTIYYGSKRATTKEWELTSEDDFLYSRVSKIFWKILSWKSNILLSRTYKSEDRQLPRCQF